MNDTWTDRWNGRYGKESLNNNGLEKTFLSKQVLALEITLLEKRKYPKTPTHLPVFSSLSPLL